MNNNTDILEFPSSYNVKKLKRFHDIYFHSDYDTNLIYYKDELYVLDAFSTFNDNSFEILKNIQDSRYSKNYLFVLIDDKNKEISDYQFNELQIKSKYKSIWSDVGKLSPRGDLFPELRHLDHSHPARTYCIIHSTTDKYNLRYILLGKV